VPSRWGFSNIATCDYARPDRSGRLNHVQRYRLRPQSGLWWGARGWFAHGVGGPAPSVVTFVCWRPGCDGTASLAKKTRSLIVKLIWTVEITARSLVFSIFLSSPLSIPARAREA